MSGIKNILIADVGSTKSDWRHIIAGKVDQFQSTGYSPYLMPLASLHAMMEPIMKRSIQPKEFYYYGTGCSSEKPVQSVKNSMAELFPNATIEIYSDMLAAARASCGHQKGIACILGTGSNACYFDGDKITHQAPSLGFWLGDEGSGGYLGKQVLIHHLQNRLPKHLNEAFIKRFNRSLPEWLQILYSGGAPNTEAAKISKFLYDHKDDAYAANLVYQSFLEFLTIYVQPLVEKSECSTLHFSGSIAFYFQTILRKAVESKQWIFGRVIEQPIAGLTLYHTSVL